MQSGWRRCFQPSASVKKPSRLLTRHVTRDVAPTSTQDVSRLDDSAECLITPKRQPCAEGALSRLLLPFGRSPSWWRSPAHLVCTKFPQWSLCPNNVWSLFRGLQPHRHPWLGLFKLKSVNNWCWCAPLECNNLSFPRLGPRRSPSSGWWNGCEKFGNGCGMLEDPVSLFWFLKPGNTCKRPNLILKNSSKIIKDKNDVSWRFCVGSFLWFSKCSYYVFAQTCWLDL